MSSHAETIRRFTHDSQRRLATNKDAEAVRAALDALVAENQRLRDALEEIARMADEPGTGWVSDWNTGYLAALKIARAALDGTPSAAQTLEDASTTRGTEASSDGC